MSFSPYIEKPMAIPSESGERRSSPERQEPELHAEHEEHEHGVESTEVIRIAYISDEGELTGGEVATNNTWAQDFADQMLTRIRKYLC